MTASAHQRLFCCAGLRKFTKLMTPGGGGIVDGFNNFVLAGRSGVAAPYLAH
jgi:hypothetical protein